MMDRKTIEDELPSVSALSDLGRVYHAQAKYRDAETTFRQTLLGYERLLGPEHTDTLITVKNIGITLIKLHKLEEAHQLLCRAKIGFEKSFGSDDARVFDIQSCIGDAYAAQGNTAESIKVYEMARSGLIKAVGLDDPRVHLTSYHLALRLHEEMKYEQAIEVLEPVLPRSEAISGWDKGLTTNIAFYLGRLYLMVKRLDEAQVLCEKVLAFREKSLGLEHTSTLDIAQNLGCVYDAQKKPTLAEPLFKRVLVGREAIQGPTHPVTLTAAYNLAGSYMEQDKHAMAETLLRRAFNGRTQHFGIQGRETISAARRLSECYRAQKMFDDAEKVLLLVTKPQKATNEKHARSTKPEKVVNTKPEIAEVETANPIEKKGMKGWMRKLLSKPRGDQRESSDKSTSQDLCRSQRVSGQVEASRLGPQSNQSVHSPVVDDELPSYQAAVENARDSDPPSRPASGLLLSKDMVRRLRDAGFDPTSRFLAKQQYPLIWACGNGHIDIVEQLVNCQLSHPYLRRSWYSSAESPQGKASWNHKMPFHIAVDEGYLNTAKFLFENGARVTYDVHDQDRIVFECSADTELMEKVLQQVFNPSREESMKLFEAAVTACDYETAKVILGHGGSTGYGEGNKSKMVEQCGNDIDLMRTVLNQTFPISSQVGSDVHHNLTQRIWVLIFALKRQNVNCVRLLWEDCGCRDFVNQSNAITTSDALYYLWQNLFKLKKDQPVLEYLQQCNAVEVITAMWQRSEPQIKEELKNEPSGTNQANINRRLKLQKEHEGMLDDGIRRWD